MSSLTDLLPDASNEVVPYSSVIDTEKMFLFGPFHIGSDLTDNWAYAVPKMNTKSRNKIVDPNKAGFIVWNTDNGSTQTLCIELFLAPNIWVKFGTVI